MAKLTGDDHAGVSLFPMFNILACTLGVMVFILATVATVSLGADKAVEIVDEGVPEEQRTRTPTWMEWDGSELVLYPSGDRVTFDRDLSAIPTFDQTYSYISSQITGTRIGSGVADIAMNQRDQYVILLVRPTGFETIRELRGYFDLLGIDVVHEPINQQWRRVQVR